MRSAEGVASAILPQRGPCRNQSSLYFPCVTIQISRLTCSLALASLLVATRGAAQTPAPPDPNADAIAALQQAGVAEVKLTVYPDTEHDAWTATYANGELYRWLLRQHR